MSACPFRRTRLLTLSALIRPRTLVLSVFFGIGTAILGIVQNMPGASAAGAAYVRLYRQGAAGEVSPGVLWDEAKGLDGLILLETNTQPGMTPTSLVPEQAEAAGISFGALCRLLVEDASCDR